jgi:transposase
MLPRIDALTDDITGLDATVANHCQSLADTVQRLEEVPGIGIRSAEELIAEIGVHMSVFPTAAHLVSWATFAPIDRQSAGTREGGATGKGNPWLAATLGEVVVGLVAPTPSSVTGTGDWPGDAARREHWWRSGTRC